MHTIKRTRSRRFPLQLRAEHADRGPYFLVDVSGVGVAWRAPAHQRVATGEVSTDPHRGAPFTRVATWVPIFARAALAFELVESEEIDAKLAKRIADRAYDRLGSGAEPAHAERFARHLLERAKGRAA